MGNRKSLFWGAEIGPGKYRIRSTRREPPFWGTLIAALPLFARRRKTAVLVWSGGNSPLAIIAPARSKNWWKLVTPSRSRVYTFLARIFLPPPPSPPLVAALPRLLAGAEEEGSPPGSGEKLGHETARKFWISSGFPCLTWPSPLFGL